MVTSVRLDPETDRSLRKLSKVTGRTKFVLVRQAVQALAAQVLGQLESSPTAYDRLVEMIGVVNLGHGTKAAQSEDILRRRFSVKS